MRPWCAGHGRALVVWVSVLLAFVGLELAGLTAARHLASADAVDVQHIPCTQPGCVNGVKDKILAFSALHDVVLREVVLFVDMFNTTEPPDEMDVQCMYWAGGLDSTPVHAAGKAVKMFDNKYKYFPFMVKCSDPLPLLEGAPRWASFALGGVDMEIRLLVEQVSLEQKGTIGACNGVIYSDRFEQLYEWLHHYTLLGVEGFHIYFTNRTVAWDVGMPADNGPYGKAKDDPPRPFAYPRVHWINFDHLPREERWLYSQVTIYNECVYRLRHTYQYLVMLDMDEFLVVRDARFQHPGGLKTMLHHVFPPQHAALGIFRYAYREDCRQGEPRSEQYLDRFTHRLKDTESTKVLQSKRSADKMIVRPDRVDTMFVHRVWTARPGYASEPFNTQPSMAYLMHIRSYGQDCSELTEEPPYDGD